MSNGKSIESNVKSMEIWEATRTILKRNPNGIRAKYLVKEIKDKTHLSRSTIYEHLSSFLQRQMIYVEKGRYWLKKPKDTKKSKDPAMMAAMAHFRKRAREDHVTLYKYLVDEYDRS